DRLRSVAVLQPRFGAAPSPNRANREQLKAAPRPGASRAAAGRAAFAALQLCVTEQNGELWDLPSRRQLGQVSTQPQRCAFQMPEDPDELAVLDEIQQELILQEQLVIEEYERSLQFDEECLNAILDGLDASNKIICPVCRKYHLTVRSHSVFCQCGLDVPAQDMTEEKLRSLLENTITEHSHRCLHNPEFTVTSGMEEEASLLMTCLVCDFWMILL
ncbi:RPA-interacting protein, partial [Meleagris gallopavo]